ncbi:DNA cytosine methyltransferase [Fusobacterium necrophorum]|uniref:DNA cytosine methyltransferase n=1 Tax=Fusobacterium necrophorum TaxID=859 RepID=UPI002550A8DE|nr:DNA cytosine methyltransferase [Fusobacterium necrophorum]MDK4495275.1 DNA cytosine methyltransferase [Fusobacterium necrophorum]MDK4509328.1 DNA cytosine methyltransferase [Fusobacterium necrophorum]
MTFIDLFSGIGGFRLGMEKAGHTCLGHVEIDKFANKSYEAIFGKEDLIGTDITAISNETWRMYRGKVDCICGGFPCQAFSIAGHRKGFEDTRGTLFFEILRAAKEIKPSYLFLENVKGLLSHDKGETFQTMLTALDELGYDAEWKVLNSKNFGVPQNRERVFIIGHLRGRSTGKIFFIGPGNGEATDLSKRVTTNDRAKKRQNGRRFKENEEPSFTLTAQDRHGVIVKVGQIGNFSQVHSVYSTEGIMPTLTTMQDGGREPKILQKARGFNQGGVFEIAPTLSKSCWECNNFLKENYRIRKLTPRECWRLQGFPDWAFDKAKEVNSDSQLYKQAGNSVTVNVIEWIARRLYVEM